MIDASGQFQRPPRSGGDLRTVLRPYHVVDLDAITLLCAWHAAFSLRTRGMGSTGPRRLEILEPLVDLRAVHPDRGGDSDSEADPVALDRHHGNTDVASNYDLLSNLSPQHPHGLTSVRGRVGSPGGSGSATQSNTHSRATWPGPTDRGAASPSAGGRRNSGVRLLVVVAYLRGRTNVLLSTLD